MVLNNYLNIYKCINKLYQCRKNLTIPHEICINIIRKFFQLIFRLNLYHTYLNCFNALVIFFFPSHAV